MATNFTPQQIEEFLQEFFNVVGTRQYMGMRYVPIFGRAGEDSIEFDNSKPYQPLTIVLYQGNSYTSRTYVPAGVPITNERYWANTGNYNAQIEAYRQEVFNLSRVIPASDFDGDNTVKDYVDALGDIIPASEFNDENTVKDYIDNLVSTAFETMPYEYDRFTYNANGEKARVWYCIIPSSSKPQLILANDRINSTEYEVNAAHRTKSPVLINAGIFRTSDSTTLGVVIEDGVVRNNVPYHSENNEHVVYMTSDGTLGAADSTDLTGDEVMELYNPVWAVTAFTPFVTNGQFTGDDSTAMHPRSWIAQDVQGNYFVACCAGRDIDNTGLTMRGMYAATTQAGFAPFFAMMLDGGASTSLTTMGIRENNLVGNTHRAVANFLSFGIDDSLVDNTVFDASYAAAESLLRYEQAQYSNYKYQYWMRLVSGVDARHFGFMHVDESGTNPEYVLDGVIQKNYDNNVMVLRVMNPEKTALVDAIRMNGATKVTQSFGTNITINRKDTILPWGTYAAGSADSPTQHAVAETVDRQYARIGVAFAESSQGQYATLYRYNFDTTASSDSATYEGWVMLPDGPQQIKVTFNKNTHVLTWGYSDRSKPTVSLRAVYGFDWL